MNVQMFNLTDQHTGTLLDLCSLYIVRIFHFQQFRHLGYSCIQNVFMEVYSLIYSLKFSFKVMHEGSHKTF